MLLQAIALPVLRLGEGQAVNIKRECGITSTLNVLGVRLFHIKEGVLQGYVFDYFNAVLVGEAEGG